MAIQEAVFTRVGIERIARYAFELAGTRSGRVASATKSNGIVHTMPFWDEVVDEVAKDYPEVELTRFHVDALAALLVLEPGRFDVILGSNLFGDPTRRNPSMFEPIHGSAPDIVGKGIANPVGQIWSAAMMLEHLEESAAASSIISAIESVLQSGIKTPDLGGTHTTDDVTDAVISAYRASIGMK
jgi:tartrate dehydrogenase/decarboxylase/D-malate dehydrogenase